MASKTAVIFKMSPARIARLAEIDRSISEASHGFKEAIYVAAMRELRVSRATLMRHLKGLREAFKHSGEVRRIVEASRKTGTAQQVALKLPPVRPEIETMLEELEAVQDRQLRLVNSIRVWARSSGTRCVVLGHAGRLPRQLDAQAREDATAARRRRWLGLPVRRMERADR